MEAIPTINLATNFTQFQAAAKLFTVPAQHMIYGTSTNRRTQQRPCTSTPSTPH
ncbi:MAG: hypothetical protein WCP28_09270 [Actinomycetes bacterium]